MTKLNAAARKALPTRDFAVPGKASTPQGKAKGGSYPIPDKSHARNALARASGKPVAGEVRAAVEKKYPGMVQRMKSRMSARGKRKTQVGF